MQRIRVLTALAVLALVVTCGTAWAAETREPATPLDGTHGYICWNNEGYPLSQPEPTCPPCWHGQPPANPIPVGIVDPCGHPTVGAVQTVSPPPVELEPVVAAEAVSVDPHFTG